MIASSRSSTARSSGDGCDDHDLQLSLAGVEDRFEVNRMGVRLSCRQCRLQALRDVAVQRGRRVLHVGDAGDARGRRLRRRAKQASVRMAGAFGRTDGVDSNVPIRMPRSAKGDAVRIRDRQSPRGLI
ncbi:hypothetical protein [Burkholderia mayonis]|uniref:Uncharacterized protein n=1 Tax=Burkholderia mayonis TaxID=1385591 RepID=A0A1B4FRG7_9BURK|nr:hypothetical protein [Burkholderia mayonis]AOJ06267.1 hypothetical protein WS71_02195 [Burkholderia mayonis]